ncbi:Hypothetical_protein [Hexamita inflata]|uniref:Hypothetical_protein n=1 Tax=Hexamita inflata TaxID=28002 RepID=A0AA86Q5W6_9EUKA|nr:Hypothetical protein HINF_LOCUS38786 [Hexamita inflata]
MIYIDYNNCIKYCNKGACELSYNNVLNRDEYTCVSKGISLWWWLMIIPIIVPIIFAIVLCCCYKKGKREQSNALIENTVVQDQNQHMTILQTQKTIFLPTDQPHNSKIKFQISQFHSSTNHNRFTNNKFNVMQLIKLLVPYNTNKIL